MLNNIRILGSCVTRDAFNLKTDFNLIDYTARTSLASLSMKPKKVPEILNNIQSKFQKRMVERDMTKRFWHSLENANNDILIIDLIDDRFDLKVLDDGSAHTISSEYKKASKGSEYISRIIGHGSKEFQSLWDTGLNRLRQIYKLQKLKQVYVNCVFYQATGNKTIDSAAKIVESNNYLNFAYSKLQNAFGKEAMIEYPDGIIKADLEHEWGLAPFHFTEQTYHFFLSELTKRMT
ncbi:MAG: DUF6270 domain-containing protein [Aliiglaciecola sp.]|uniref:DUF6270 domain-containing protein n=1 Tax=Aliiglaciecola sp. TaxID=1872441 RepID=UPI00329A5713